MSDLTDGGLEGPKRLAERLGCVRETFRAENNERDDCDDNRLRRSHAEERGLHATGIELPGNTQPGQICGRDAEEECEALMCVRREGEF